MRESNYTYISGKIRAMEPGILDETDIDRMINARDLEKAFRVLDDTDYDDNLLGADPKNYREVLVSDLQQVHEFLQKATPDPDLFKLMMLARDFVNLKLLFKSEFFNVDVDRIIKENAVFPPDRPRDLEFENHINYPEEMRAYIQGKKGVSLDEDIKKVIRESLKTLGDKCRPDDIDAVLSRHYYDLALTLAKKLDNDFLLDYFRMCVDVVNLLIFIRSRRLELDRERFRSKLIPGGRIDISRILRAYPDDPSALKPFVNAHFSAEVSKAFDAFCENEKIFQLERVLDNYRAGYIKRVKTFSCGPEVVFAYYLAKSNASANIGIILTGKLNKVPKEEIRKTIREPY